jgi:hypothetical protein
MSKLVPVLLAVLAAALIAGCGGQNVSADEVPGAPVALKVPEVSKGGSDALAGNRSSSDTASSEDSSATPTPTATAQSGTSGTSGTTQSGNTGGTSGTTQQQTQQGNGTSGQSQGGGGNTFNDFCKNNPGAC